MNVVTTNSLSFQGVRSNKLKKVIQDAQHEGCFTFIGTNKRKKEWTAAYVDFFDGRGDKLFRDLYSKKEARAKSIENGALGIGKTKELAKRNLFKNTIKMFDRTGWPEGKIDPSSLSFLA